ncbi:MAG: hypothetical protein IPH76_14590 [Xanthomonadales bacterium]|nr:hypothetical protein [Xanthomonadales bacterium]
MRSGAWRWWPAMLALARRRVWRSLRALDPRRIAAIAGVGVVVALHWLTFTTPPESSCQTLPVAATCMALGSVFAALIEPFAAHRRFAFGELLLGIPAIPGVVLVRSAACPPGMWLRHRRGRALGAVRGNVWFAQQALRRRR